MLIRHSISSSHSILTPGPVSTEPIPQRLPASVIHHLSCHSHDQTFHLIQSQHTDTRPSQHRTYPTETSCTCDTPPIIMSLPTIGQTSSTAPVVKMLTSKVGGMEFAPCASHTSHLKSWNSSDSLPDSWHCGVVLRLVGLVSVYCGRARKYDLQLGFLE